jgi:hypothetical protein
MSHTIDVPLAAPVAALPFARLVSALGGLLGFGCAAALTVPEPAFVAQASGSALFSVVGAAVLTTPPLLVAHQVARLQAPIEDVVAAVSRGLIRAGGLAAGFAPAVLWLSLTSGLAWVVYPTLLAVCGAFAAFGAIDELVAAERRQDRPTALVRAGQMGLVAFGWCVLAGLVALRLFVGLFASLLS